MGLYYIAACHDCKTKTMFPKSTLESSQLAFERYKNQFHDGHNTQFGHDEDEHFEAVLLGKEVTGNSYYGLVTKRVGDPYRDTDEGDRSFYSED